MKTKHVVLSAMLVAGVMQACGNHNNPTQGKQLNQAYDVSGDNDGHAAHDTAAHDQLAAQTHDHDTIKHEGNGAPVAFSDQDFVNKAMPDGLLEVKMGQLAIQKAQDKAVKAYGERMVKDHTKAGDKLKAIATAAGLSVPSDLDAEGKHHIEMVQSKTGHAFDVSYVDHMVNGHQKAVELWEKATTQAKDAKLRQLAVETLPTLKEHRAQILEISKTVK